MPGLGTSFGRGGATTAPQDLLNADVILIMGSNMAENHPVAFQWAIDARESGAKLIHVDPRFTRTSAMADVWIPLRAGSDIVLLGALVRMSLKIRRTSANTFFTTRMQPSFFARTCGTPKTWTAYSRVGIRKRSATTPKPGGTSRRNAAGRPGPYARAWLIRSGRNCHARGNDYHQDLTLQHPRCVYQVLKRHFSRYTPEMVEQACGVPPDLFLNLAETFCSASGPDKTASICYALGWTQHSKGSQLIRTAAILQLLLGNIGRPGGGILALARPRVHSGLH